VFVIAFAITCERSRYAREPYYNCSEQCKPNDVEWFKIHGQDSFVMFWSAGIVCFILGLYQIGTAVAVYNQYLYEESHPEQTKA